MIFEIIAAVRNRRNSLKKESFKQTEENSTIETWSVFDYFSLIAFIMWMIVTFGLYFRIIIIAFYCSVGQGLSSMFVPSLYGLYKFGELIKMTCVNLPKVV